MTIEEYLANGMAHQINGDLTDPNFVVNNDADVAEAIRVNGRRGKAA